MAMCDDYFSDTSTPVEATLKVVKGFITLDLVVNSIKEKGQDQN